LLSVLPSALPRGSFFSVLDNRKIGVDHDGGKRKNWISEL
jgi:hypothetical protein